jgi:hypothetical protein
MSLRVVALVALADGVTDSAAEVIAGRLSSCAESAAEIERAHAGLHLPGSIGGGELTWDLQLESEAALDALLARGGSKDGAALVAALGNAGGDLAASIAHVDAVAVAPIETGVGRPGLTGVKRTLLFEIFPDAAAEAVERFEMDMLGMPTFVPAIRNWSFARAGSTLPTRWTHVWEQEYERLDGLQNDYMTSPYHWGLIDAWYDPECPQAVVDPRVAHVYCPATESVLSWSHA